MWLSVVTFVCRMTGWFKLLILIPFFNLLNVQVCRGVVLLLMVFKRFVKVVVGLRVFSFFFFFFFCYIRLLMLAILLRHRVMCYILINVFGSQIDMFNFFFFFFTCLVLIMVLFTVFMNAVIFAWFMNIWIVLGVRLGLHVGMISDWMVL